MMDENSISLICLVPNAPYIEELYEKFLENRNLSMKMETVFYRFGVNSRAQSSMLPTPIRESFATLAKRKLHLLLQAVWMRQ